jgi:hypothetical protein
MTHPADPLVDAALALRTEWSAGDAVRSERRLTDTQLVALNDRLAALRRQVDGLHTRVAAEIAARSRPELGKDGLARAQGFRSPAKLIAAATGGHTGDAARLIQVGEAARERTQLSGEAAPPKHPHVGAAVRQGTLSVAAGAAITTLLDRLALRSDPRVLDRAEQTLVEKAPLLCLEDLQVALRRTEALLDPDGLEPRVTELRGERSLRITHDAAGMTVLTAKLDPETAAPVVAAIEGIVTHQLRVSRGHNTVGGIAVSDGSAAASGAVTTRGEQVGAPSTETAADGGRGVVDAPPTPAIGAETRSLAQLRADALTAICRHVAGCDRERVPGSGTTVIVRMSLDQLSPGAAGVATIDGLDQPIDAGTARRLAARAGIIPMVLGTDGQVLDLGREKRGFTEPQRLVLGERDGGCVGCHLPPAYCEAHHLTPWSRGGRTDVDDGVLLCTGCHHRVHDEGWDIRVERPPGVPAHAGTVWMIPPPHVDPARVPRVAGRALFDPLVWGMTA